MQTQESANLIGGLARYLRTSRLKGTKFASPPSKNSKPRTAN